MGSDRRIALALGVESLDDLTPAGVESLLSELTAPKTSSSDKLRMLPLLERMSSLAAPESPGTRRQCQQVVRTGDEVRLSELPVPEVLAVRRRTLRHFPAGPHGRSGKRRPQRGHVPDAGLFGAVDRKMQLACAQNRRETLPGLPRRLGRRMPVAVCLGGDPAYAYAADGSDAGRSGRVSAGRVFLRGRPVELVRCLTCEY